MSRDDTVRKISTERFEELMDAFSKEGPVYVPREGENYRGDRRYRYEVRSGDQPFAVPEYRSLESLKTFLFRGRMKVAEYPDGQDLDALLSVGTFFVVGAAACDIEALKSLNAVFLQDDFTDVFYQSALDSMVLVGIDCTVPRDTCFCTLAGHGPAPREGFDLSLSPGEGYYLVEAGSETGERIMADNAALFAPATGDILRQRDSDREKTARSVREQNSEYELDRERREILELQRESDDWYDHVETCVGCGACLFACPTCHCFLLYDQQGAGDGFERIKEWDACIYAGFSRMAGGSTPRLGIMERFRHRYLHKLEYYPKNFGFEACTGCGRCIEGCMGRIDMRSVLKKIDELNIGV